jgi:hypothetical protein
MCCSLYCPQPSGTDRKLPESYEAEEMERVAIVTLSYPTTLLFVDLIIIKYNL